MENNILIFKIFKDDFPHMKNATQSEIDLFKKCTFYLKDRYEMWNQMRERFWNKFFSNMFRNIILFQSAYIFYNKIHTSRLFLRYYAIDFFSYSNLTQPSHGTRLVSKSILKCEQELKVFKATKNLQSHDMTTYARISGIQELPSHIWRNVLSYLDPTDLTRKFWIFLDIFVKSLLNFSTAKLFTDLLKSPIIYFFGRK